MINNIETITEKIKGISLPESPTELCGKNIAITSGEVKNIKVKRDGNKCFGQHILLIIDSDYSSVAKNISL